MQRIANWIGILLRLFIIAFIWMVYYRVILTIDVTTRSSEYLAFAGMYSLALIVLIPSAFIVALFIWNLRIISVGRGFGITLEQEQKSAKPQKTAKRRDERLDNMLALLDEDDRYDIQQRIRQRLIDQIDSVDATDMDSFEELLGKSSQQKQKYS